MQILNSLILSSRPRFTSSISPEDNSNNTTSDGKQVIHIVGDSLFAGNTDSGTAIPDAIPGAVFQCDSTGNTITEVVGKHIFGELNGSPWIQFANQRYLTTGLKTIICNTAVGGSTVYPTSSTGGGTTNTWYPGGARYTAGATKLANCLSAAGVSKQRVTFVSCGINDEQSPTALSDVQLGVESLRSRLLADNPGVKVVWCNFGWLAVNSLITRASNITTARARFIRKITMEQARDYENLYMGPYWGTLAQNGYMRSGDIHFNDAGNVEVGSMLSRWMNNYMYSKESRAIIASHYDDLSTSRKNAIQKFINDYGKVDYYKTDGIIRYITTDTRNIYLDWCLKGGAANPGGFTFNPNTSVSLNGTSNCINTGLFTGSPVNGTYATQDNAFFAQKIITARDPGVNTFAFGGALNSAAYVSLRQLSGGAGLQWRINETSNVHNYTGATNFANNTVYGVIRTGATESGLIINTSIVHTSTAASVANIPTQVFTGVLATNEAASTEWMDGDFGWVIQAPANINWQNAITRLNELDVNWNL